MPPKLLYLVTEDWFFFSHFLDRARAAKRKGFDVIVATRPGSCIDRFREEGFRFIPVEIDRRSVNPWEAFRLLLRILRIYFQERPDLVHHIALKPALIGTLAAKIAGIKAIVNAPVGMGFMFSSESSFASYVRPLAIWLLKITLNPKGSWVVLENRDDLAMLIKMGAIRSDCAVLIRGAGVDVHRYFPQPFPAGRCRVLFLARMLRDKGLFEFVAAAKILKAKGVEADFLLAGSPDSGNPTSVSEREIHAWQGDGIVQWLGHQEDVSSIINQSHIVCLPSYREGLPKALLEAMACGRPIVTTDVPGCREAVQQGENGLIVPAKAVEALAKAIEGLIVAPSLWVSMGKRGREMGETEFSSEIICEETMSLYQKAIAMTRAGH